MSSGKTTRDVVRELAALEDPKMREANTRRGDDHGVNLTHLRALAKRLKTQHDLALRLWATGDTAGRLLATLVCSPKAFSAAELDAMIGSDEFMFAGSSCLRRQETRCARCAPLFPGSR
jgi:3-methyladenine DNA glycosylase AlkD